MFTDYCWTNSYVLCICWLCNIALCLFFFSGKCSKSLCCFCVHLGVTDSPDGSDGVHCILKTAFTARFYVYISWITCHFWTILWCTVPNLHKYCIEHSTQFDLCNTLSECRPFATHISQVRVAILWADPITAGNILKGMVGKTSIASSVSICPGAVDQLLLTQLHKLPACALVLGLQSCNSSKCPAWVARALALYLEMSNEELIDKESDTW